MRKHGLFDLIKLLGFCLLPSLSLGHAGNTDINGGHYYG